MFSFSFFGFPVAVSWSFWLTAVLLGSGLSVPTPSEIPRVVTWVAVVFFSILWHELGHALLFTRWKRRCRIELGGLGGLTIAEGGGAMSRVEQFVTSAAGPAFSIALGSVVWLLWSYGLLQRSPLGSIADGQMLRMLVPALLWVNLGWALVNLLPVLPLDGGQMLRAVIGDYRIASLIGLIVAVLVATAAVKFGQYFIAILFGLFAYDNYQRYQGKPTSGIL
jgi:Zn-dependent protease